jgi:hypothetical protein
VLLQPLVRAMAVLAAFHPLDQLLPSAGDIVQVVRISPC